MMVDDYGISAADAALLLTSKLGQLKAWTYFLADNIRERQDVAGFQLLPYMYLGSKDGRCSRPLYRRSDIDTFVDNVLTAGGMVKPPVTIELIRVRVDNTPGLPWRARRATRLDPAPRRAKPARPGLSA